MNTRTTEQRRERAHLWHEVSLRILQGFALVAMAALTVALGAQLLHAGEHMRLGEQPSLSPVTAWILAAAGGGGLLCALWCALTWIQKVRTIHTAD